jgi:hypothetical protein
MAANGSGAWSCEVSAILLAAGANYSSVEIWLEESPHCQQGAQNYEKLPLVY